MQFSYQLLLDLQHGECFYCSKTLGPVSKTSGVPHGFTRDHFFPRDMGLTFKGNMILSCARCNRKKGNKLPLREEVIRYHHIWSHIPGGCAIDLTDFLFTQQCIDILHNLVGPPVDTRHII